MAGFRQLDKLPAGELRQAALLPVDPEWLSTHRGLSWTEARDERDAFVWAGIEVGGRVFVLLRYVNSPERGMVLYAPDDVPAAEAEERVGDALAVPALAEWTADEDES